MKEARDCKKTEEMKEARGLQKGRGLQKAEEVKEARGLQKGRGLQKDRGGKKEPENKVDITPHMLLHASLRGQPLIMLKA